MYPIPAYFLLEWISWSRGLNVLAFSSSFLSITITCRDNNVIKYYWHCRSSFVSKYGKWWFLNLWYHHAIMGMGMIPWWNHWYHGVILNRLLCMYQPLDLLANKGIPTVCRPIGLVLLYLRKCFTLNVTTPAVTDMSMIMQITSAMSSWTQQLQSASSTLAPAETTQLIKSANKSHCVAIRFSLNIIFSDIKVFLLHPQNPLLQVTAKCSTYSFHLTV